MFVAALTMLAPETAAQARRIVIDGGGSQTKSGYCSPAESGRPDCAPVALPFSIVLGPQSFNSFVAQSNGVVSFGSQIDFSISPGSLADYGVPLFTPLFDNRVQFIRTDLPPTGFGDDGAFLSRYAIGPDSLRVTFFTCRDPTFCGPESLLDSRGRTLIDGTTVTALEYQAEVRRDFFTFTLNRLADGFSVDYAYPEPSLLISNEQGAIRRFGFSLPNASLDTVGPLTNQSFRFDANGALVGSVPEPATWAMMLLGFGAVGYSLRRRPMRVALAE